MGEEGGDEVAEEGLSVGGFAAEMAVFEVAAGHGGVWGGEPRWRLGGRVEFRLHLETSR